MRTEMDGTDERIMKWRCEEGEKWRSKNETGKDEREHNTAQIKTKTKGKSCVNRGGTQI